MKILIACEYSGTIRDAFIKRGHNAISCDLLPTEQPGPHYQGNVFDIINDGFDLMIAHPPCKALSCPGRWYYRNKIEETIRAAAFFMQLINAPINKICIENPQGIMSAIYKKPDQYIEPYYFGEPHRKKTGLWLKNLSRLNGLQIVAKDKNAFIPLPLYEEENGKAVYFTTNISGTHNGAHIRSKTFNKVAEAMAAQWA